ncbi:MAG: hypothetical protein AB7J13_04830 [Pyrinomonadaceae bacterium]
MKSFATALWVMVLLAVPLSGLILFGGMATATGAPQEAVVICLALAVSILPYIFARAVTEIANLQPDARPKVKQESQPKQPVVPEPDYNYKKHRPDES